MDFDGRLPQGWDISSRLMARWTFSDGSTIEVSRTEIVLTDSTGKVLHESDDLRVPMATGWPQVLVAAVSFLEHDGERYRHFMGPITESYEDPYLFGDEGAEWAYMHDDELSALRSDLDPDGVL